MTTFRIHLLLTCLIATAGFAIVVAIAVFVPLAAQLSRASLDVDSTAGLADHFLFLHAALWPLVVLSLMSCIVAATFLFERMRAPLVRFKRCFESISEGTIPDAIVIRSADYLVEEAALLNRMIAVLGDREAATKRASDRLLEIVGDLAAQGVDAELLEELQAIAKGDSRALSGGLLSDRADA